MSVTSNAGKINLEVIWQGPYRIGENLEVDGIALSINNQIAEIIAVINKSSKEKEAQALKFTFRSGHPYEYRELRCLATEASTIRLSAKVFQYYEDQTKITRTFTYATYPVTISDFPRFEAGNTYRFIVRQEDMNFKARIEKAADAVVKEISAQSSKESKASDEELIKKYPTIESFRALRERIRATARTIESIGSRCRLQNRRPTPDEILERARLRREMERSQKEYDALRDAYHTLIAGREQVEEARVGIFGARENLERAPTQNYPPALNSNVQRLIQRFEKLSNG